MDLLNKNATLTVRMSIRQLEKLHEAATIESERRDERVEPSRLFRELAMQGVGVILAEQPTPEPAA